MPFGSEAQAQSRIGLHHRAGDIETAPRTELRQQAPLAALGRDTVAEAALLQLP